MKFIKVGHASQFGVNTASGVEVEGKPVALVRLEDGFYAVSNVCTHEEEELAGGMLEGNVLECPLHAATFDVRTGKVLTPPAELDLETYPVRVEDDGSVLIGIKG